MSALEKLQTNIQFQLRRSPLWLRWQQLPERDRLALLALSAFLAVVLVYLLLWQPIQQQLKTSRNWYEQQTELHRYLQAHSDQARQAASKPKQQLEPDALQGLVTSSAQLAGLSIERIDSDNSSLQVNLAPSAFSVLLPWLQQLQSSGVLLGEVNLERDESGQVLARLSLMVAQ